MMRSETSGKYLTVPRWERIPWLVHGFGTAAWKEADFRKTAGWADFRLVLLDQIHSDVVHEIKKIPQEKLRGDALITRLPRMFLAIKTADCLPVLIVDEERRVIAAAHCGWKGTQKRLLERMILKLREEHGCRPSSLLAALGPCIGPECYEVGEEVEKAFKGNGFPPAMFEKRSHRPGKYLLNLRAANLWLLRREGLKENNIFSLETCTCCSAELLSYRKDREIKRRMYAFIGKQD